MKSYFIIFITFFVISSTQASNIYPNQASQSCMDLVEKNFNIIQRNATALTTKVSSIESSEIVGNVKLQFSYMKDLLGYADLNLKFIHISDIICKKSEIAIQGTIAHEFGHIMSMLVSKELSEDRNKDLNNHEYAYWEKHANFWAAKIFKQAKLSSNDYLKLKDQECNNKLGIMYACNEAKYWRIGLDNKKLVEDNFSPSI